MCAGCNACFARADLDGSFRPPPHRTVAGAAAARHVERRTRTLIDSVARDIPVWYCPGCLAGRGGVVVGRAVWAFDHARGAWVGGSVDAFDAVSGMHRVM